LSVLSRLAVILCLLAGAKGQQELRIAAASDLSAAMQKLVPLFERQSGTHVSVSLGSSGNFFAQIQNGAPFDVFLSADKSYPEKLEQAGLAEAGTFTPYARGRLVLWMPKGSNLRFHVKDGNLLSGGLEALLGPEVRKIAIANPEHAPYGRAAVAALEYYKIYGQVKSKLVLGENISQTAQFAQSGNADVGLIALSLTVAGPMANSGRYVLLPEESYAAIEQAGTVVRASRNKEAAKRFLQFLVSAEGQSVLRELGFGPPQK
jgi:molybdate transport system substrate-binding protein